MVRHYRVAFMQNTIGSIRDLVVDENWDLPSMIVRKGFWPSSRLILGSSRWAQNIDWAESTVWTEVHPSVWDSAPDISMTHLGFSLPRVK